MNHKSVFIFLGIVVIACIPLIGLLPHGLPVTHDGPDHVARIANFYRSFIEGNSVPRWAANLNWGYGHPILMFLYPLPSYIALVFRFLGASFVDSVKLVFGVTYVMSVVLFYLWGERRAGKWAGLIGALLYGFSSYRFVDLYVRGAIGEHVAFMFPPLILLSLDSLVKKRSFVSGLGLSLGIAGLLLSHNAVSLIVVPILLWYGTFLLVFRTKEKTSFFAAVTLYGSIGVALSAFFLGPAYFEGKYTLRDIVTRGEFSQRFVPLKDFFFSTWNYGGSQELSKNVGFLPWLTVGMSILIVIKKKVSEERAYGMGLLALLVLLFFLMTSISQPIWMVVTILQKFQFPWRLLTGIVLVISMLGVWITGYIPQKLQGKFVLAFLLFTLVTTREMWVPKAYIERPESYYTGIYNSTTDTGESSPIWSVRFMEHRPQAHIASITGAVAIEEHTRTSTRHQYTLKTSEKSRIVENTLYFPGWNVFVNGKPTSIEFQDPAYRGLMTFWIQPGISTVEIVFRNTKVRSAFEISSMMALGLLFLLGGWSIWKKNTS